MTSDRPKPPEDAPKVWLHDILAEYDRLGPSRKWICGDLALRRAAQGIRDKDGRSFVGHPDDPPVFPPDEK